MHRQTLNLSVLPKNIGTDYIHLWIYSFIKPHIRKRREWFTNKMRVFVDGIVNHCCTICEQFAYCSPWIEICQFFARTQRELDTPSVLCLPQVCGKLINCAPSINCLWTVWFACSLQVSTGLYIHRKVCRYQILNIIAQYVWKKQWFNVATCREIG